MRHMPSAAEARLWYVVGGLLFAIGGVLLLYSFVRFGVTFISAEALSFGLSASFLLLAGVHQPLAARGKADPARGIGALAAQCRLRHRRPDLRDAPGTPRRSRPGGHVRRGFRGCLRSYPVRVHHGAPRS